MTAKWGGKLQIEMHLDANKKQQLATLGYLNPMRLHDDLAVQRALQAFIDDIPKLAVEHDEIAKEEAIARGFFSEEEFDAWRAKRYGPR